MAACFSGPNPSHLTVHLLLPALEEEPQGLGSWKNEIRGYPNRLYLDLPEKETLIICNKTIYTEKVGPNTQRVGCVNTSIYFKKNCQKW